MTTLPTYSLAMYGRTRDLAHSDNPIDQAFANTARRYADTLDAIITCTQSLTRGAADVERSVRSGISPVDWVSGHATKLAALIVKRDQLVEQYDLLAHLRGMTQADANAFRNLTDAVTPDTDPILAQKVKFV